uniref:Coproporphyrinogen-III oxidase n=1 Tax=uncultured bacterium 1042 TaxID=548897 RepID=B8R8S6_9BACT|nr:putative coproporphyrinogen III oxidase [uncultured bacterium 1042]
MKIEQAVTTRPEAIARLGEAVPRYTSYPTAPHFHPGVGTETVRDWLEALAAGDEVSLYVHVPYCDRLCWFCACNTRITRRYEPVAAYLQSLLAEIATIAGAVGGKAKVRSVHFGGGSPTMLKPQDIVALDRSMRGAFDYLPDAEVSVEIDPNDMDEARFDALAAIGLSRVSLGVQDFDPKVQKAINRLQSFEQTRAVVEGTRARGVRSVNLDLLYGLPHQTCESVAATMEQALSLQPDRIALFGYAHVPWFKKHQTMIDEAWLPDGAARLAQSQTAASLVQARGYQAVGLDHFAKPDDTLAVAARNGTLRRNFQGYTDDRCETLIGLGPSSISRFRQGYAQNAAATADYQRRIGEKGMATARGIAFSDGDRLRSWVIERLMCDFAFSATEAVARFGNAALPLLDEAAAYAVSDTDGLLERHGDDFVVGGDARHLVRIVAAHFDSYLPRGGARHSAAV